MKITREQYDELCEAQSYSRTDFHELLESITGIEARPYTGYSYYDSLGNYIGDSDSDSVRDLLNSAYIEIEE